MQTSRVGSSVVNRTKSGVMEKHLLSSALVVRAPSYSGSALHSELLKDGIDGNEFSMRVGCTIARLAEILLANDVTWGADKIS